MPVCEAELECIAWLFIHICIYIYIVYIYPEQNSAIRTTRHCRRTDICCHYPYLVLSSPNIDVRSHVGQVAREGVQSSQGVCSRHCRSGVVRELHEVAVQVEDARVLHPSRGLHGLNARAMRKAMRRDTVAPCYGWLEAVPSHRTIRRTSTHVPPPPSPGHNVGVKHPLWGDIEQSM